MTTHYYGADLGDTMQGDVTDASSTTSKAIELVVVTSTTGLDKQKLLNAVEAIKQRIVTDTWPPA